MPSPTQVLEQGFYAAATPEVARGLLGKILISELGSQPVSGRIVETEAYLPKNDPACHAAKHRTARTEVMFGPAGRAYVYPIHAKHCFNIVTEQIDQGCAVLIRAVEPLTGIATMQQRRNLDDLYRLATGPACLCQAFGIDRSINGVDLTLGQRLWLEGDGHHVEDSKVRVTHRIGVTSAKHRKLRFVMRDHPFASGPKKLNS